MLEHSDNYNHVVAYSGVGSDIKWCGRWRGGKKCLYCRRYVKFDEWSQSWYWHYLVSWYKRDQMIWGKRRFLWWDFAQANCTVGGKWLSRGHTHRPRSPIVYKDSPRRYYTVGMSEREIKSLIRNGCKKKRKCRCMKLSQRGSWCCPKCYNILSRLAGHYGLDIHDALITDREELKEEILILLLSGTL